MLVKEKPPRVGGQPRQKRSQFWWLMPKPFDWLSSALYIGVLLFALVPPVPRITAWQVPMLVGTLLALLTVDRAEYWLYSEQVPARMAALLFIVRAVLIEVVILIAGFEFTPWLYLILPYLALVYFGEKVGYGMAALVNLAYLARVFWYQPQWYLNRLQVFLVFLFFFGVVFVVLMARVVSREQASRMRERASRLRAEKLLAEVEHAHRQLMASAQQVAELAMAEERNRVAREIHDGLGHALIAINVQLEKALVYHDTHPEEAIQAISDAKRVAKEALHDVRRSVRTLRTEQEPFSCSEGIARLVQQLRSSELAVDLHVNGREAAFAKQTLMTLYRVTQEALTNIQKHAHASVVQVDLSFTEEEARVSIRDDGCGFDAECVREQAEMPEGGYGLQGMRERVALIGGSFHLESQPGRGTLLSVTVAKTGMAAYVQRDALGTQ